MFFSSFTRLWCESIYFVKICLVYNILQIVTYVTHNFWNLRIIFVTFLHENVFYD